MLLPSEVSAWNFSYLSRHRQRNVCRALVISLKTRLSNLNFKTAWQILP